MRAARFGYNLILLRHIYMKFANCLFIAAITFTSSMLEAQSVAVADLQQDMDNLSREVGRLRLEVEQLRRENSELLKRLQGLQGSSVDSESVRAQISGVRNAVNSQNEALKQAISLLQKDNVILAKVDGQEALKWGLSYGIRAFQGPYIDEIEVAYIRQTCPARDKCTATECLKRRRFLLGSHRGECAYQSNLDKIL